MSAAPLERYVTAGELAELMGVSVRTVKRWTVDGIPSETWGMGHTRRYLPSAAIAWARERRIEGVDHRLGRRTNAPGTNGRNNDA